MFNLASHPLCMHPSDASDPPSEDDAVLGMGNLDRERKVLVKSAPVSAMTCRARRGPWAHWLARHQGCCPALVCTSF